MFKYVVFVVAGLCLMQSALAKPNLFSSIEEIEVQEADNEEQYSGLNGNLVGFVGTVEKEIKENVWSKKSTVIHDEAIVQIKKSVEENVKIINDLLAEGKVSAECAAKQIESLHELEQRSITSVVGCLESRIGESTIIISGLVELAVSVRDQLRELQADREKCDAARPQSPSLSERVQHVVCLEGVIVKGIVAADRTAREVVKQVVAAKNSFETLLQDLQACVQSRQHYGLTIQC